MIAQIQEQKQTKTQPKLQAYIVTMATHELDPDEIYEMPLDSQDLELFYPSNIEVDKAFLERDLSIWLKRGYYLKYFSKKELFEEF